MQKRSALDSLYLESNAGLDDEIAMLRTRLLHEREALAPSGDKTTLLDDYIAASARCSPPRALREARDRPAAHQSHEHQGRIARRTGDELTFSEVTIGGRPPRAVACADSAQRSAGGTHPPR